MIERTDNSIQLQLLTPTPIARTPGLLISRPEELRPEGFAALIEKLAGGVGCYFVAAKTAAV